MRIVHRLAAAAVVLLLAGCAGSEAAPGTGAPPSAAPPAPSSTPTPAGTPSSSTPKASPPPASPTSASPTSAAPSATAVPATLKFSSTTVDGEAFEGATLAGEPVLLWFWAPWCPTCRSQIGQVQSLARDYEGKVTVIGVGSLSTSPEEIKGFADDAPGLTHLSDADGAVFRHFEVVQQSSFVLLDAAGDKVWSVGYGGSEDLADQVAAVAG